MYLHVSMQWTQATVIVIIRNDREVSQDQLK